MALEAPRPLRGQCARKAVRKKVGLRGVVRLGEYGPGGTKATEKPMCKESCEEKISLRGVPRLGESGRIWPCVGTKATERPMCKESCEEKG